MNKYMEDYEIWKELFNAYFGREADIYWKIFTLYENEQGISYEKLAILYNYSASKIRGIVHQVKEFLDNPIEVLGREDYPISILFNKSVRMPNLLIRGKRRHSPMMLATEKIFHESVCLYQNLLPLWIPRSHIIVCGKQFVNKDRREHLYQEMKQFVIYTDEGMIQIYESIDADKKGMRFSFTEQALEYIDICRYVCRNMAHDFV